MQDALSSESKANVYRFDIQANQFARAPKLNKARQRASSCMISGNLYTVGGWDSSEQGVESIERLNVKADAREWELFNINTISSRRELMVGPLNDREMLVAGGYGSDTLSSVKIVDL